MCWLLAVRGVYCDPVTCKNAHTIYIHNELYRFNWRDVGSLRDAYLAEMESAHNQEQKKFYDLFAQD